MDEPNAMTMAKLELVISMFPDAMASIARHEEMIAKLMKANVQLAERVVALETALDEAPAVQIAGAGALGRATGGSALTRAQR
jgi:hypothetical protein